MPFVMQALCCLVSLFLGEQDIISFADGQLTGWTGSGFQVVTPHALDLPGTQTVGSGRSDERGGRKALLHREITIPSDASMLFFRASAIRPAGVKPKGDCDVVLFASGKRIIPKRMRIGDAWQRVEKIPTQEAATVTEFSWHVAPHQNQNVRIVLVDEDDQPGCHLVSTGFRFDVLDKFEEAQFSRMMVELTQKHGQLPMLRYVSPHFVALSNAEESFTERRVKDCELMYACFQDHFSKLGFKLHPPPGRLMVAIFDSQSGFEAYLGRRMSPLVTGVFHAQSNRFVMYDYGRNQAYVAQKQRAQLMGKRINAFVDRQTYLDSVERQASDARRNANIGTIMHEVSHQLAFNMGLLSREGDIPLFLAEGLACYCEATSNGSWQGLGQPNPERLRALARATGEAGDQLPLSRLVASDQWMRGTSSSRTILLGYAKSWALVRYLLETQPAAMRTYLATVYTRKTPEYRMRDFQQAFGKDLMVLERQLDDYIQNLLKRHPSASN